MRREILILAAFLLLCPVVAAGQNDYMKAINKSEIKNGINDFISEMTMIGDNLSSARTEQLEMANRSVQLVDARWMDFFQRAVEDISADEELLNLSLDYEQARTAVQDSINIRKERMAQVLVFVKSEKIIADKAAVYLEMEKRAKELSLTKVTAKELENLKAKEALDFMEVTEAYSAAKGAFDINPALQQRMDALQARYIALQNSSTTIQEMAFVPLVTRIKDYLLSIAAVAVIMMFFVFISNYIKTLKNAKESAKKMEELLQKNDKEIPTI